jgi:hypothetical protein
MTWRLLALLVLTSATPAFAQLVIEPPVDLQLPREFVSAQKSPGKETTPRKPLPRKSAKRASKASSDEAEAVQFEFDQSAARASSVGGSSGYSYLASSTPTSITISTFDGDAASGSVRADSTWVGNVTQNTGFITIGGTARDDNGWRLTGLSLDATGMGYINVIAQRHSGHAAGSLFLQFEDIHLNTHVFSLGSALFSFSGPTQAQITIGQWPAGFDSAQISGWSIGGGGVGTAAFQMSLYDVSFTTTAAIPEPATVATLMGLAVLGGALCRRRRVKHLP